MSKTAHPASDLTGRVILVTGAGRGIGAAVSRALARHGATVVLCGRRTAALERVYDSIEGAGGPPPAAAPLDLEVAAPEAYEELAEQIGSEFGRLDGLLHNAAHLSGLTPLANYRLEDWFRTIQVNLNAAFLLTRACLPLLHRSPDASVVFSDDTASERAYYGAYGASKSGLRGLMRILAAETEVNTAIRVNSLDPGPVHTGLRERIQVDLDGGDLPAPEDVCAPYLHLLGPDSHGVTGRAFRLRKDGSWAEVSG